MERMGPQFLSRGNVRVILVGAVCLLVGTGQLVGDNKGTQRKQESIQQWVVDLGSRSFKIREIATRKLVNAGQPALERVLHATRSDDLEVALRAVRILKKMAADNGILFDALSRMATSDKGTAVIVGRILKSPTVLTGNRARLREKVDGLLREAILELKKGELKTAREKVAELGKINDMFQLGDAGMEFVPRDIEFAKVHLAAEAGNHEAKMRLKVLNRKRRRKKRMAERLLYEARVALKEGHLDSARQKALVARKLDVRYTLFDDSPDLVLKAITERLIARLTIQKR